MQLAVNNKYIYLFSPLFYISVKEHQLQYIRHVP